MGLAVVTVAAGGLAVVEVANGRGMPVTEAANGFGVAVTKVIGKPGLPVIFVVPPLMALAENDGQQADRDRARTLQGRAENRTSRAL